MTLFIVTKSLRGFSFVTKNIFYVIFYGYIRKYKGLIYSRTHFLTDSQNNAKLKELCFLHRIFHSSSIPYYIIYTTGQDSQRSLGTQEPRQT